MKVIPKTEIIKVSPFIFDAPIEKTEKKTERLVKKFLQFTPGQQQNRFVRIRDTLPIAFSTEEKEKPNQLVGFFYSCYLDFVIFVI